MSTEFSEIMKKFPITQINPSNVRYDNLSYIQHYIWRKPDIEFYILRNIISFVTKTCYITIYYNNKKVIKIQMLGILYNLDINNINCEQDLFQANLMQDLHGMDYEFIKYCNDLIEIVRRNFSFENNSL